MAESAGLVLYDGSCGFCARWVPLWAPTLRRLGLDVAPLQGPAVAARTGLSDAELLSDLTLLLGDGRVIRGADVYRYVMRRLWWAYPFYLLAIAPGLSRVFDWSYRTFARNRYHVSRACGLDRR